MVLSEKISDKRQKLLEDFEHSPIKVNEVIYVEGNIFSQYSNRKERCQVVEVSADGNTITVVPLERGITASSKSTVTISKDDIVSRVDRLSIGANPFIEKGGRIRGINYSFDSIIFEFELVEPSRKENYNFDGVECRRINWNPFVYDKDGKKQYYQRGFCWSLKDKQNLIDSIYNGINLGMVLVRNRAWDEIEKMRRDHNETDLAFKDIVDGKQRLNAIKEFLNNEFKDSQGNYFDDLSGIAQNKFTNHSLLQYAEMDEHTSDEDVLYQFLKLNFAGVPQSTEHIAYVKSILSTI